MLFSEERPNDKEYSKDEAGRIKMLQDEIDYLSERFDQQNFELIQEQDISQLTQKIGKIGYWDFSLTDHHLYFSKSTNKNLSLPLTDDKISLENFITIFDKESFDVVSSAFRKAIDEAQEFEIMAKLNRQDSIGPEWVKIIGMLYVEDGISRRVYGIIQDITEQKKQDDLVQKNKMLEESVAFKSEFLAQMSHEIRTPMNGIVGLLDVLSKSEGLTEQERDYLKTIQSSSDDLISIITNVLNLSKLEAGKEELMLSEFDLKDSIDGTLRLYEEKASLKGIDLFRSETQLPKFVESDKVKIGQVLRNLISNAVKYSDSESKIEVIVKIVDGNRLRIEVKDEGRGIRTTEIEKLFTKYSQTSSSIINKFEGTNMGTGLGLQISKHIVELLKGRIGVDSEFGKGSTFWFEIPIKVVLDQGDADKEGDKAFKEKFDLNVLVVEDKLVNQKVAQVMLQSMGCKVEIANNGEEGVMAIYDGRTNFDIILMDIQMPIMDGITATAEIRKIKGDQCPPIVALSAKGMEGDADFIKSNGLDDYLAKPVKLDQLKNILNKYFN